MAQNTDNVKRLHESLSSKVKGFTVPYEQFAEDMKDEAKLKTLHGNLSKMDGFTVPYEQFKIDMLGESVSKVPYTDEDVEAVKAEAKGVVYKPDSNIEGRMPIVPKEELSYQKDMTLPYVDPQPVKDYMSMFSKRTPTQVTAEKTGVSEEVAAETGEAFMDVQPKSEKRFYDYKQAKIYGGFKATFPEYSGDVDEIAKLAASGDPDKEMQASSWFEQLRQSVIGDERYGKYAETYAFSEVDDSIERLISDTKKISEIYAKSDKNNVLQNFGTGVGVGVEQYVKGYTELLNRMNDTAVVRGLEEKIRKFDSGENVKFSEEEKILMKAMDENFNAHKQIDGKLPSSYNIGVGVGGSIGFIGEFILAGGIAKTILAPVEGLVTAGRIGGAVSPLTRGGLILAEVGIRNAAMPSTYQKMADRVAQGESGASAFVNAYTENLGEVISEYAFMGQGKAGKGVLNEFLRKAGLAYSTEKGVLGMVKGFGEEYTEEKLAEIYNAPKDYDSFSKFFADFINVKKNLETFGTVTVLGGTLTAPSIIGNSVAKVRSDVVRSGLQKRLPTEITGAIDQIFQDNDININDAFALSAEVIYDALKNGTIEENYNRVVGDALKYAHEVAKAKVRGYVEKAKPEEILPEDAAEIPTVKPVVVTPEMTAELTEQEKQVEYLKSRGQVIPDGTDMETLNKMFSAEKTKERTEVNTEIDTKVKAAQEKLGLPQTPDIEISDDTEATLDRLDEGLPVTNEFIKAASQELYDRYKELEAMKTSDTRLYTTEQIESMQGYLGEEIERLENYASEQKETGEFVSEVKVGEVAKGKAEGVAEGVSGVVGEPQKPVETVSKESGQIDNQQYENEFVKKVRTKINAVKKPAQEPADPSDIEAKRADIERRRKDELQNLSPANLSVMASDYLLTGGIGSILSSDYFIQSLMGSFTNASVLINNIRNKYSVEINSQYGNLSDFVNSELYGKVIGEIREAINSRYENSSEALSILDEILKSPTGVNPKIGNQLANRLDKINLTTEQINEKYDAELKQLENYASEQKETGEFVSEVKVGEVAKGNAEGVTEGVSEVVGEPQKPVETVSKESGQIVPAEEKAAVKPSEEAVAGNIKNGRVRTVLPVEKPDTYLEYNGKRIHELDEIEDLLANGDDSWAYSEGKSGLKRAINDEMPYWRESPNAELLLKQANWLLDKIDNGEVTQVKSSFVELIGDKEKTIKNDFIKGKLGRIVKSIDESLSGKLKRAIDSWLGVTTDMKKSGIITGVMNESPLENLYASEPTIIEEAMAETKSHLREKYGDTITLYRSEDVDFGKRSKRTLLSYTSDPLVADFFYKAGKTNLIKEEIPIDDIVWVTDRMNQSEFIVKSEGVEDAVQVKEAGRVPVQPAPGVGEKVEGRAPEAKPKEVTGEKKEVSWKQQQFDVIQRSNPMTDEVHTGIRKVEDIKTADEVFAEPIKNNENPTPDFTVADMKAALESGEVTIYSSNEIADGVFVTPSKMQAKSYSGDGKVYSKKVALADVAWIDMFEGQYAKVKEVKKESDDKKRKRRLQRTDRQPAANGQPIVGKGETSAQGVRLVDGTFVKAGDEVVYKGETRKVKSVKGDVVTILGVGDVHKSKVLAPTKPVLDTRSFNLEETNPNKVNDDLLSDEVFDKMRMNNIEPSDTDVLGTAALAKSLMNGDVTVEAAINEAVDRFAKRGTVPDHVPFFKAAPGAKHTSPYATYNDAVRGGDNVGKNLWVRNTPFSKNTDRVLLVQFSSNFLYGKQPFKRDKSSSYFDKLYRLVAGYNRTVDFWEVPLWMARIAGLQRNADVYVVRDIEEAKRFINEAGYKSVHFSALDVNEKHIVDIVSNTPGTTYQIGGYTDFKRIESFPNVTVYKSIDEYVKNNKLSDIDGTYSYRHFKGTAVIPRLKLSEGCLYKCAFCSIPKKVIPIKKEWIDSQIESIKDLDATLVYLDDKTFGQAENYTLLPELYERIKEYNPDFKGFIIQTTALDFANKKRFSPEYLKNSHIQFVELGVETYNDDILTKLNKKHSHKKFVDAAMQNARDNNIKVIPNIIVGLSWNEGTKEKPDIKTETRETYQNTLDFLEDNKDIISHVNVYSLALYEGTELSDAIDVKEEADKNENIVAKSWQQNKEDHEWAMDEFSDFASNQIQEEKKDEVQKEEKGLRNEKVNKRFRKISRQTGTDAATVERMYNTLMDVFGLSQDKALAGAVIVDRMVGTMAKRTNKTKDQVYATIKWEKGGAIAEMAGVKQDVLGKARGAMMFMDDANAVIMALTDPNVTTPLHELAHVYEKYLTAKEKEQILKWTGEKSWSVNTSESFARGFERFLYDGTAPGNLKAIFQKFAAWLKDIYKTLVASEINIALNEDMRRIYSTMLGSEYVEEKVPSQAPETAEEAADAFFGSAPVDADGNIILSDEEIADEFFSGLEVDENGVIKFQFIGATGAARLDAAENNNNRIFNLREAMKMTDANKTAEEIKLATGWEKGKDKRWRYEIPDNMKMRPAWDKLKVSDFNDKYELPITEAMDYPELFAAYPELEKIKIRKDTAFLDIFQSVQGWYDHDSMELVVSPNAIDPFGTILHELQHAVQMVEGFATGTNTEAVIAAIPDFEFESVVDQLVEQLERDIKKNTEKNLTRRKILSGLTAKEEADIRRYSKEIIAAGEEGDRLYKEEKKKFPDKNPFLDNKKLAELRQVKHELRDKINDIIERVLGERSITLAVEFSYGIEAVEEYIDETSKKIIEDNKAKRSIEGGADKAYIIKNFSPVLGDMAYNYYKRVAGETEARNVAARAKLTPEQRRSTAESTEDVPRDQQIVMRGGKIVSMDFGSTTVVVDGKKRPVLNSEGRLIHNTEEGVINFWKWFSGSKVVDAQGRPLVVYHGTRRSFDEFNPSISDLLPHFGTIEQANEVVGGVDEFGENIVSVYLSIKNPLRLIDLGGFDSESVAYQLYDKGIISKDALTALLNHKDITPFHDLNKWMDHPSFLRWAIEKAGYDGVIYLNRREGLGELSIPYKEGYEKSSDKNFLRYHPEAMDSYMPLFNTNIKSATGNSGTFSPETGNILFQEPKSKRDIAVDMLYGLIKNETSKEAARARIDAYLTSRGIKFGVDGGNIVAEAISRLRLSDEVVEAPVRPTKSAPSERVVAERPLSGKVKESKLGIRVIDGESAMPQNIKTEIMKGNLHKYDVFPDEVADATAAELYRANGLDGSIALFYNEEHRLHAKLEVFLGAYIVEGMNREISRAEKDGRIGDANYWSKRMVDFAGNYIKKVSVERAQGLAALNSARVQSLFPSRAFLMKYEQDVSETRKTAMDTRTFKRKVKQVKADGKKAHKEVINDVLEDLNKKLGSIKEGASLRDMMKQKKALLDELKARRKNPPKMQMTIPSIPGLDPMDVAYGASIASVYIQAGVYGEKLVKGLVKDFKSIDIDITEEQAEKMVPDVINVGGVEVSVDDFLDELEGKKEAMRLANRIFGAITPKKESKDPLTMMLNTLMAKFNERNLNKPERKKISDIEKIGEAIRDKAHYSETWAEARKIALDMIEANEEMDVDQKEIMTGMINDAYDKATAFTYSERQVDRAIRAKMKDMGMVLADIVRAHFDVQVRNRGSLTEALIIDANIDRADAEMLARSIERRYDSLMSEHGRRLIKKYTQHLTPTQKKSVGRRSEEERLLELINIGAFDDPSFVDAFASARGLVTIDPVHVRNIKAKAEEINKQKSRVLRLKKTEDLLGYMATLEGVSLAEIGDAVWYASVLSGMSTQVRNIMGGGAGVGINLATEMLWHPSYVPAMLRGIWRGVKFGKEKAEDVLKYGYSPYETRVETPRVVERYIMNPKALWIPPLAHVFNNLKYVSRFMAAADMFNVSVGKEAWAELLALEHLKLNDKKVSGLDYIFDSKYRKQVRSAINTFLGVTKEQIDAITAEVEADALELGYTETDKKIAIIEGIEMIRPGALVEVSTTMAVKSTGNTRTYGMIGFITDRLADVMKGVALPFPEKTKTGEIALGVIHPFKYVAAFTKIVSNVGALALEYVPFAAMPRYVSGAAGAAFKPGGSLSKIMPMYGKYYHELSETERKAVLHRQIVGMVFTAAMVMLSDPGDDDDPIIQITADGTGDWNKNNSLKDWKPYSLGIKVGDKRVWVPFRYTPLILALAPIGWARDRMKYSEKHKDAPLASMLTRGYTYMPSFLADMTAIQSMNEMLNNLFTSKFTAKIANVFEPEEGIERTQMDKFKSDISSILMDVLGSFRTTLEGFYTPGVYRDMVKIWENLTQKELEMPANELKKLWARNPISVLDRRPEGIVYRDVLGRPTTRPWFLSEFLSVTDKEDIMTYHTDNAEPLGGVDMKRSTLPIYEGGKLVIRKINPGDAKDAELWDYYVERRGYYLLRGTSISEEQLLGIEALKAHGVKGEEYQKAVTKLDGYAKKAAKEDVMWMSQFDLNYIRSQRGR